MARRFRGGDRVIVPQNRQTAPTQYYGRIGTITFPTDGTVFDEVVGSTGQTIPLDDQPCLVRFDGDEQDTSAFEDWFEHHG
jgi:hypothetical protein